MPASRHLLSPELVKEFISEFHQETNRLNAERARRSEAAKAELARVEAETRNIILAVKQGMMHASMQNALTELAIHLPGARCTPSSR